MAYPINNMGGDVLRDMGPCLWRQRFRLRFDDGTVLDDELYVVTPCSTHLPDARNLRLASKGTDGVTLDSVEAIERMGLLVEAIRKLSDEEAQAVQDGLYLAMCDRDDG